MTSMPETQALRDSSRGSPALGRFVCLDGGADAAVWPEGEHACGQIHRKPATRRTRIVPLVLGLADMLALSLAFAISSVWWGGSIRELALFALSLPCWLFVADLQGLYHRQGERIEHLTTDDLAQVFRLVTIAAWMLLLASRVLGWNQPRIFALATLWLLAAPLVPLARAVARRLCKLSMAYQQNTVIVGAGDVGQLICRKLIKHPEYGANVVGFVDTLPKPRRPDLPEHITILGGLDQLPDIVERLDVARLVIAFSTQSASELLAVMRQLRSLDIQIDLVPWLFELVGPRASAHAIEGLPVIGLPPRRVSTTARLLKRTIDFIGAVILLIVLSPLMAYIAIRIRLDSHGPVLFRQTRLGTRMREFTILKFRTMHVGTDTETHRDYVRRSMSIHTVAEPNGLYKLDRFDSITRFGRWLRRTSLDELPQLLNVLKGDMSLVGPRPCIPYEAEFFAPHHLGRFLMPQGLTGLWQLTARANSTYAEALDLDLAYVRDWSFGLDLRLLLRTPLLLLGGRAPTT